MPNPFGIEGPFEQEKKQRDYMHPLAQGLMMAFIIASIFCVSFIVGAAIVGVALIVTGVI